MKIPYWAFSLVLIFMVAMAAAAPPVITPSPYWKNQIVVSGDDAFWRASVSSDPSPPEWIKFTILVDDPATVYFQNGGKYLFHYDFATNLLDPFLGISLAEFDRIALHAKDQRLILGAVLRKQAPYSWPYPPVPDEYGIQLVRMDPFTPEEAVALLNLVKSKITADPGVQAYYFPTYEQLPSATQNVAFFASAGFPLGSTDRWADGNALYAAGWALGRLKFFPGGEIASAFQTGALTSADILLTDGVPAEVPPLAGLISLSPSTPNSHAAILAASFGMPFVHLALAKDADRARALVGRRIALRAYDNAYSGGYYVGCEARLIDTQDQLDDSQTSQILALKIPPPLAITPMARLGEYSRSTEGLRPPDIKYFGGKASNFGILREAVPNNSPVALAFSFDLWNDYLDQAIAGGRTLREEIAVRMAGLTYPPANMGEFSTRMADIRELFTDTTQTRFDTRLEAAILGALTNPLHKLDPHLKIRFRSSTNVEDTAQFTGAGLYDSFSGCLADDLDSDESGPCDCDPSEPKERGVFRAIRKVYASFYNDNAVLARLRYRVDERQAGMALLVHHSFPDEIELANGVATVTVDSYFGEMIDITLATQAGAVAVTNPEDGSIPEEVHLFVHPALQSGQPAIVNAYLISSSNLVQLGGTVLNWEADYEKLGQLIYDVWLKYKATTGITSIDLEYKKEAPSGALSIKQVRALPSPGGSNVTPFLINEPAEYCTFQGMLSGQDEDVFAVHRLKSRWFIETRNTWLTTQTLATPLYLNATMEYAADGRLRTNSGKISLWPEAAHGLNIRDANSFETTDIWTTRDVLNPRRWELKTGSFPLKVGPAQSPLLTLRDASYLALGATYVHPVKKYLYNYAIGNIALTSSTTEYSRLVPVPEPQAGDILRSVTITSGTSVTIRTSFYWPPNPTGPTAGYSAPLIRWKETVIEGLTSEPIRLRGFFSQSYTTTMHNGTEYFLFEPRLEPGISPAILKELRQENIALIYACRYWPGIIRTIGFDPNDTSAGSEWVLY